ncbi:TetR/AcrR family transcriptional regulator [Brevibacillus daliensis]|uniref:TetR/AcrR family transcriptional regulator n=1 Tax=Brevibacillus daliensis TaxID=2892995 RepID=UPI001E414047|nr:TetR/AcrR family transcriptional regulator [Brevibacillus daliensis]
MQEKEQEEMQIDHALQAFFNEYKDVEDMTEKQRRIMQASVKLFASKGFHASSTSEIAKEAGVAEGTIFRYYKSKKDILIAAVAPVLIKFAKPFIFRDIFKILEEANKDNKPFEEVLIKLINNRFELLAMNMKHFRVLLQEAFFHEELREAVLTSISLEAKKLGQQFVKQRIDSGELRNLPPEIIIRVAVSSVMGILLFKHVVDPEEYSQYSDEEHIRMTVDILMNGIKARS